MSSGIKNCLFFLSVMLFKQISTIFKFFKLRQTITNFRETISAFVPLEKETSYNLSTFRPPCFILGKNDIKDLWTQREHFFSGGKNETMKDLARILGKLYVVYNEVILKFEIHIFIFFRYIIIKYFHMLNYSFILFRNNNNIRTTFSNLTLDS